MANAGGPGPRLPTEVEQLIQACLASFNHVEALLLLARDGLLRTADQVAAAIHTSHETAARVLDQLASSGLLAHGGAAGFVYAPRTDGLREAVNSLRLMYETKPVTLVRAVYARPSAAVRTFSESFRLRDNGEEDNHG